MAGGEGGAMSIDRLICEIEDYVGGNIEQVDAVDRMGFTVFLREPCDVVNDQGSCYRIDQQGTGVYLTENRRNEQP
jgi:hypothetical protein